MFIFIHEALTSHGSVGIKVLGEALEVTTVEWYVHPAGFQSVSLVVSWDSILEP